MSVTIDRDLKPKKILFILMPHNFRDEEFVVPYKALKDALHEVHVAGFSNHIARGSRGHEHQPDVVLDNLHHNDLKTYDALVIPGGPGSAEHLWDNPTVIDTIKFFYEHKKLIAAICHACIALAQAGILTGKKATVYPEEKTKELYKDCGVTFVDQGCFVLDDDRIITAQGPEDAETFAQKILINL